MLVQLVFKNTVCEGFGDTSSTNNILRKNPLAEMLYE